MKKSLAIALVIIGGIVLSVLILGGGMMVARVNWGSFAMNPFNKTSESAPGTGMGWTSGGNGQGYSMMGNGNGVVPGAGMGGFPSGNAANVKPLMIDQARQAVEDYLTGLNNPDLELKEIMIFDNNAYARITEKSTGIGAMELLVDPVTLIVFPEYGPNMMWNQKYGHMGGNGGTSGGYGGMMGGNGMMGSYNNNSGSASATMTVTAEQANKIAQQYLDQQFPGYKAAADPDPFYGYYTIDILKDDQPTGMLSVNGFSGQVFLHTWHGTFIEMWD